MARNKPDSTNNSISRSERADKIRAIARARSMMQAARRWADAAAEANAWDASRFAWLSKRAASVACHEAEQAQKTYVDQAALEVMQRCAAFAQEDAQRATRLSKQAPCVPMQPSLLEHLRQAEMNAWDAYLRYSDNDQPEAKLEVADLRAAYDRVHRQRLIVERLLQRVRHGQVAAVVPADDVSAER